MLGRSSKLGFSRRVVVHYLFFCMTVVAWLLAGAVLVTQTAIRHGRERSFLSYLEQAAATTALDLLRKGEPNLQSLVERFSREQSLLYCAIVSPEGRYLAHTYRGQVGKPSQPLSGKHMRWGEIDAIRCSTGENGVFREYRVPLQVGDDVRGTLQMAARENGLWSALREAGEHAPLTLIAPLILVAVGAIVLGRMVIPLAHIETQLTQAAIAPTLTDTPLRPVQTSSPGAMGWNRLIEQLKESSKEGGLDQRLAEALQSRRQDKADDILNSITDGLAVTDHERRITFANHALLALIAKSDGPDSLAGKTILELLDLPDDHEALEAFTNSNLLSRSLVFEIEHGPDTEQVLRIARNPIRSAGQKSNSGHVWSVRDMTQQRLAEKMRNQFLDSATHELRTPLANIKAYAETLALSEMLDVEKQKEFCNTINSEATRLARFVDDLLSISSMEVGSLALDRQNVDLPRLFSEVVDKLRPQMDKKHISFVTVFPEKYPKLALDKDKLTVALVNLLGNAAKYTNNGGQVAFKVQLHDSQLQIEIEDTGVGIAEDELPQVFDKFFRSDNPDIQSENGTGLGLSMAQEVIRLHGGELTVQSQLGEGTTFTVALPLAV